MITRTIWLAAALVTLALPLQAAATNACIRQVVDQGLMSKISYQMAIAELFKDETPRFSELAGLNAQAQIAFAARRQAQFLYLMDHHPESLALDRTLVRLVNFPWTAELEAEFVAADETYALLTMEAEIVRMQNDQHPDWPAFRAEMIAAMAGARFLEITQAFSDEQYAGEMALLACNAVRGEE